jgi:hypothetical protein
MMQSDISRRRLMKSVFLAGTALPALGWIGKTAHASEVTPLDPSDPVAKAFAFATDASKVDPAANPGFKPGQHCAICAQFQGKPTDAAAGCNIFAGHSVPAGGWCKVWGQRSS